jgi:ectoine hydroxylase-related dioxygenase (phytanoyl-CoA dioxygenase family)
VLVAMTPNKLEQGCVKYIPGTHLNRGERKFNDQPYEKSLFGGVIHSLHKDEYEDRVQEAVPVELNTGEYSFHDIHSVHSSEANQSSQDRILLNFKYFPTNIVPRPDKLFEKLGDFQPCYLVRGQDLSNLNLLKRI